MTRRLNMHNVGFTWLKSHAATRESPCKSPGMTFEIRKVRESSPMRRERAEICTANMQISGEHAHIVICETQQTAKRYAKILERSFVNLKARGPSAMLPE